MPNVNELLKRIDAEFAGSQQKMKDFQTQQVEQHEQREQRLASFGALLDELSDVWRPRLEALRERFGDQVKTAPTITPTQRSVTFSFATELARVNMRLSASPDADARHAIFSYDLDIMPILMKFDSHSEIEFPLEAVDRNALAAWFDDQIVGFVRTYLSLHENQYYLKGHMVEDPIAKIQFPKFAAGATFEHNGKTIYFVDETTRAAFVQQAAEKKK